MIATLTHPRLGQAVLDDNGIWHAQDSIMERHLNTFFNLEDYSVADGDFGYAKASEAAKAIGATLQYAEPPSGGTTPAGVKD